ncbi:probable glucan endo-1,3-beta-glucosidase A6 [Coffea eugenioides]|uniref:probable glucan endo-1,3-beta-glucosidase A6 n=1 Tax=Coffea eugenioides TaxID=49369 RepID=UPI000F607404|nr:probable glucan endo-1,3-beta-glucosidase A6 [Coffea eugenioides]
MALLAVYLFYLLAFGSSSSNAAAQINQVGVCYGQLGNNLPTPSKSVQLLQKLNATQVKLYDANPKILNALIGSKLYITVMVPNELIINISSNQTLANQWVQNNVIPYYPRAMIRYILVGNEVLSYYFKPLWFYLVPAVKRIHQSVKTFGLSNVKVGTPLAIDMLESSVLLPSNGTFRSDIAGKVVKPLLQFLNQTNSFFFVDLYPYFEWVSKPNTVSLGYALLAAQNKTFKDPVSGLVYNNLLDQMLDSVVFAMKKLGYPSIPLFIAETGWPNGGDLDQIGASIYNAATYNRNVVKKFTAMPSAGTPARPGVNISVNIFALYNENQKPGPGTERHFGLLYPNGTSVYDIDLSGHTPDSSYSPLPQPSNNKPYKGKLWCVVAKGASWNQLGSASTFACGQENRTCAAIRPGGKCYKPNWSVLHASYAFSAYWAQFRQSGATCFFNGLAVQTTKDPSYLSCQFPSVNL